MFFSRLRQKLVKFFFKDNLLITNSISSGICMVLGDIAQQEIEYRREIVTKRYDWSRVGRMFIVGTAQGPAHHYYYLYLDKILPKTNLKTVAKKVLADQCFASPVTIISFFIGMGLLEHKSMMEIIDEISKKMKYVYLVFVLAPNSRLANFRKNHDENVNVLKPWGTGDCMFWPPVQIINFYFLPPHYRVFYINVATMIFNIFMSYMKHYDQHIPTD